MATFHLRTQTMLTESLTSLIFFGLRKLGSAIVMGSAIAGMHYTVMAAVSFKPTGRAVVDLSDGMNNSLLTVGIGIATLIILMLALLASLFNQRISAELVRAEALRQSEERFRSLVQNSSDIISVITTNGIVCYISLSVKQILGHDPEDWLGKKFFELVHFDDLAKAESLLTEALHCSSTNITDEFRLRCADGRARDFEVVVNNLLAEPSVAGIVITYRDITEHKQAEEAIQQAEEKYRSIFEKAVEGIFQTTTDGRYINANPALARIYGYESPEELITNLTAIGQQLYVDPNRRAEFIRLMQEHDVVSDFESQVYCKDGSEIWITENARTIRDASGTLLYYEGSVEGITERKQAEEALAKSEAKFRSLIQNSSDIITILDTNGTVQYESSSLKKILGYQPEDLIGKNAFDFIHPEDVLKAFNVFNEVIQNPGSPLAVEFRFRHKDGLWRFIESTGSNLLADPSVAGIVINSRDITERKQAEAAIERERNQLRQIINNAPVAMAMFDTQMRYLTHSQKWLTLYGLEQQSLLGRSEYEVFPDIPEKWKLNHQRALKGEALSSSEDVWEREDGSKEYQRWALHPWYKPNGEVGGIVIVAERINELVEAREAAVEASRLKSEFLASMSHELRTPLNAVIGMTGLLLNTELKTDQRGFVKIIRRSSDKLLTTINDILDFSKIESGKLELEQQPFELQTCVETSLSLVASQAAEKGLKLAYSIAPPTPSTIIGDAARLGQILVNLLSNAVKFTQTGEVIVSVTARKLEARDEGRGAREEEGISEGVEATGSSFSSHLQPLASSLSLSPHSSSLAPRPYYEIHFAVKDTGIGIPQQQMEKLFKSFSQVDSSISRRYGGTGLGLVICKQLTEIMGGRIWVESQVGTGSTFYFRLVAQASSIQLDTLEETIEAIPRLAQQLPLRILLAEDNRVNQLVALLTLEQLGYQADAVSNGLEVLQSLRRQPYDVVLMDIQMPEMDGLSATRQIYQEWSPQQRPRIIAITAYATQDSWQQCLAVGMDDYISKPIQIAKLVHALRQCQPKALKRESMKGETPSAPLLPLGKSASYPPRSSPSAPIDAKTLQALRQMAGARATEVLAQLIDNYLEEAPQLLQAMHAAMVTGDAAALHLAAHKLRSASANLGATTLSQLCKTLEAMGGAGTTAGALTRMLQVEAEYETVKTALQMERQRG